MSFQRYDSSKTNRNTLVERIKAKAPPPRKMIFTKKEVEIEARSKEIQTDAIYEPKKIIVKEDITSMKLPDVHIPAAVIEKQNHLDITSFIKSLEGYRNLDNAFYGYNQFISKVKELELKMKETSHLFDKEAIVKATAKGVIEVIPANIKKHLSITGSENLTTINNYLHKLNDNEEIAKYVSRVYLSLLYKVSMEGILTDRYTNTLKIWGRDDVKTKYITETLKPFIRDMSRVSKYMYEDDLAKVVDNFIIESIPDEIKLMIPVMKDCVGQSAFYIENSYKLFLYKLNNKIPNDWNGSFKMLIDLMESIEKHSITKCAVKTIDSNIELFRERETKAVQRFTEVVNGYEQEIANKNQDIKHLQNNYKSLTSRIDEMETEQKKYQTMIKDMAIAYEDARIEAANQSMMNEMMAIRNACSPIPVAPRAMNSFTAKVGFRGKELYADANLTHGPHSIACGASSIDGPYGEYSYNKNW